VHTFNGGRRRHLGKSDAGGGPPATGSEQEARGKEREILLSIAEEEWCRDERGDGGTKISF
jgi:hypothetical protein